MTEQQKQSGETVKAMGLLEHFERIVELSKKKGFTEGFWEKAKPHLDYSVAKLQLSMPQAAIFAHFLNRCDDQAITIKDIAISIKCSRIKLLRFMDDIDELEKRKLIRCRKREHDMPTYRVPIDVIRAVRKNEVFTPASHQNISLKNFFTKVGDLFDQKNDNELSYDALVSELKDLQNDNPQLSIASQIKELALDDESAALLLSFCNFFVNKNDDEISIFQLASIFGNSDEFSGIEESLKNGEHPLMECGLVEFANDNGYVDNEQFHLTEKAKQEFLTDLSLKYRSGKRGKDFIFAKNIAAKQLYYSDKESAQIQQLTVLLGEDKFSAVQNRLKEGGMRGGFACLFYGPPGTGKTETVYQIARQTGRDILPVDISKTKSCWFGDSEKAVKQLFDRYRGVVKAGGSAPILLFNEADAVIGKRTEIGGSNPSVEKTLNAMQNIILQEIENLEGILIATTNFETSMDAAFERRFLFKIKFEKPDISARRSIWQTIIGDLSASDAAALASRFNFSGGQIENIARKRTIETIISGNLPSLETLISFCQEEMLVKQENKIGFGV
ncbi:MAG: ATP-binding protein [Treponema sp.]|jgi:hypothetical protein|nr:ATP-binding protein [Treponema sp.]